ncbi:MAG: c-type cytochrome [Fidelibacterota bacterium]
MGLLAGCSDMGSGPPPEDLTFSGDIQVIFDHNCTTDCHEGENATGGLNLSSNKSYENLVNVPSNYVGLLRVEPGNADSSSLYLKVIGNPRTEVRMPLEGNSLSEEQILKIKIWIDDGAQDN